MTIDAHLKARLDRVAAKLAAAARRPGEPVMFGASAHRFELGPPLTEDEVTAFEPNTLATPFPAEPGRVFSDWPSDVAPGDDDEPYCGTLALSDQGCGYLSILVVSGPARGRVTDTSDVPAGPGFTNDADFLSRYERWLDAVLAGATHFR